MLHCLDNFTSVLQHIIWQQLNLSANPNRWCTATVKQRIAHFLHRQKSAFSSEVIQQGTREWVKGKFANSCIRHAISRLFSLSQVGGLAFFLQKARMLHWRCAIANSRNVFPHLASSIEPSLWSSSKCFWIVFLCWSVFICRLFPVMLQCDSFTESSPDAEKRGGIFSWSPSATELRFQGGNCF